MPRGVYRRSKEVIERLRQRMKSKEMRQKISKSKLGKPRPDMVGENNWNYGKHLPDWQKQAISKANSGPNSGAWKGDDVGNKGLHEWVRRHLQKPDLCEDCNLVPPYDLACVTRVYNRDFENWRYLCRSCHHQLDRNTPINPTCFYCGSKTTALRKERDYRPHWYRFNGEVACSHCYSELRNPGYTAIHMYIKYNLPRTEICPICESNKPNELSNIDHKYSRSLDDWIWLCSQCHKALDHLNKYGFLC